MYQPVWLRAKSSIYLDIFFWISFSVDSFLVKTRFVGLVDRITVEHDNTGIFPDWNLEKVPLTQINNLDAKYRTPPLLSKTHPFISHPFLFEPPHIRFQCYDHFSTCYVNGPFNCETGNFLVIRGRNEK